VTQLNRTNGGTIQRRDVCDLLSALRRRIAHAGQALQRMRTSALVPLLFRLLCAATTGELGFTLLLSFAEKKKKKKKKKIFFNPTLCFFSLIECFLCALGV
jgi:hypothetical protein